MPLEEFEKIDFDSFATLLDEDIYIEGNIKLEDSVLVKGTINGVLSTNDLLVISPNSTLKADIFAKDLQCFGKINGNIKVENEIYLHSSAEITGDIEAKYIIVEKGCKLNGKIIVSSNENDKSSK